MFWQEHQSLVELYLDKTQVPLSGIACLLMVSINEQLEIQKHPTNLEENIFPYQRTQHGNDSIDQDLLDNFMSERDSMFRGEKDRSADRLQENHLVS